MMIALSAAMRLVVRASTIAMPSMYRTIAVMLIVSAASPDNAASSYRRGIRADKPPQKPQLPGGRSHAAQYVVRRSSDGGRPNCSR